MQGVVALEDGLLLIADVPAFLSSTEQEALALALAALPGAEDAR